MPLLSRFTPTGLLALSSQPSLAESIYESLVTTLGGNFSVEPGSRMDGWCYANAMGFSRAWATVERAGNQAFAAYAYELLTTMEREYGIIPGAFDSVTERRAVLSARMLLPLGGSQGNVATALETLLGDEFIAFRPTLPAEAVTWPTALGDQPMNLQLPTVPRRRLRLVDALSNLGSQEVEYELLDPPASLDSTLATLTSPLLVGETLVVEPEDNSLTERLSITALRKTAPEVPADTQFYFTATFTKTHNAGCTITTMPYPMWNSTQLHHLVVLTPAAAIDIETRRKVHELMHRIVRGVATWDITDSADGLTTTGPFRVGVGRLGVTTIGEVTI